MNLKGSTGPRTKTSKWSRLIVGHGLLLRPAKNQLERSRTQRPA